AVTDVAAVVAAARAVGAKIMLDGAQRAPHGPLDVRKLDVDFYAFSGHKTYGPTGIGVLWGRRELLESMPPFMTGGQMIEQVTLETATFRAPPRRFEAGTPPLAGAIGGVPASKRGGGARKVAVSSVTCSIIWLPVMNGGIDSRSSRRPHSTPMPVGP